MEGLLEPELIEEALVRLKFVRSSQSDAVRLPVVTFNLASWFATVKVRIRRGSEIVFEGNLDSLKRMKEDAREVNSGYECGIGIDNFNGWKESDVIEAYRMISKRRTLSPK